MASKIIYLTKYLNITLGNHRLFIINHLHEYKNTHTHTHRETNYKLHKIIKNKSFSVLICCLMLTVL